MLSHTFTLLKPKDIKILYKFVLHIKIIDSDVKNLYLLFNTIYIIPNKLKSVNFFYRRFKIFV